MGWASGSPLKRLCFSQGKPGENRSAARYNGGKVCLIETVRVAEGLAHVLGRDGYRDSNVPTSLRQELDCEIGLYTAQLGLTLKGLVKGLDFVKQAVDFSEADNRTMRLNRRLRIRAARSNYEPVAAPVVLGLRKLTAMHP